MDHGVVRLSVFSDNLLNHFFSLKVLRPFAFDEHVSNVRTLNRLKRNLNFSLRVLLELPNSFALFADNQTDDVVWNGNYIRLITGRSVGRHHRVVIVLVLALDLLNCTALVQLLGNDELLVPDFVSGVLVSRNDALYSHLGTRHGSLIVSYQKHMLLVVIVGLRRCTRLLTSLAADEDLAARFFFKSFLVEAFGPNNHSDIVDAVVLGDVDLSL